MGADGEGTSSSRTTPGSWESGPCAWGRMKLTASPAAGPPGGSWEGGRRQLLSEWGQDSNGTRHVRFPFTDRGSACLPTHSARPGGPQRGGSPWSKPRSSPRPSGPPRPGVERLTDCHVFGPHTGARARVCAHVVTDNPTPPDGCARGLRPANKPSHQGSPLCGRGPPSRPLLCSPE